MKKTKHEVFVLLSSIFIIMIVFSTWLYLSIYSSYRNATVKQGPSEEEKMAMMLSSIKSADPADINFEQKVLMINSIKSY